MQERNITPEESLSIIEDMIQNSRRKFANNGFSFLLWGIIVIIGSLLTYYAITAQQYTIINPAWLILSAIGVVATVVIIIKRDQKNRYKTHIDFIGQMLWFAFFVSGILLGYVINHNINPIPVVLALLGMATFTSGALMQFFPLYIGGALFWIAAVAASRITTAQSCLLMALAMLTGYIVPGVLLRIQTKKGGHV